MHSPIQVLRHSLGVALFFALFLVGRLMVVDARRWADTLMRRSSISRRVSKIFLFAGKMFEVVAVVGGFVEAVAVMVLASGWLIELVTTFGVAE